MTDQTPLTGQQLDDIEARAAHFREYGGLPIDADPIVDEDVPALVAEVRRLRAQPSAFEQVEQAFAVELNDDRALTLLDALIVLRSKLPCTCARSQGLHETGCRRYVPGHDLLSPARRLTRAREELRRPAAVPAAAEGAER